MSFFSLMWIDGEYISCRDDKNCLHKKGIVKRKERIEELFKTESVLPLVQNSLTDSHAHQGNGRLWSLGHMERLSYSHYNDKMLLTQCTFPMFIFHNSKRFRSLGPDMHGMMCMGANVGFPSL